MAALTIGCLVATLWFGGLQVALGVIAAGTMGTIARRLVHLSKALRA
jgi:hypothetical protein